jgi:predicted DCC family thiol-disulfide oxidoreductase YuxK
LHRPVARDFGSGRLYSSGARRILEGEPHGDRAAQAPREGDAITAAARSSDAMNQSGRKLTVFYDGACPRCVRDRAWYESLCGATDESVEWLDITGRDAELRRLGIDPAAALRELHVRDADGVIRRELDAYILLLSRVPRLKPLAWLIGLPGLRPLLSRLYRAWVLRRLRAENRL